MQCSRCPLYLIHALVCQILAPFENELTSVQFYCPVPGHALYTGNSVGDEGNIKLTVSEGNASSSSVSYSRFDGKHEIHTEFQ